MMAHDLAALFAGSATLVQLAAVILVVFLLRRHPLPLLGPIVIGAFALMIVRRGLAVVAWPDLQQANGVAVTREAAGLAVSLAVAVAVSLLWRISAAPAPEAAPADPAVGAADVALAREEERELLCYDLHDGLAQLVMATRMHLDAFNDARGRDATRAERELSLMSQRVEEAVGEVRQVIADLSLAVCPEVSLDQAVGRYLEKLAHSQKWEYEFDDRLQQVRLPTSIEAMGYRLVQEALNNVAKHAQADRVRVSLSLEDGDLVVVVQDWGVGFDPDQVQWNTGQLGLRGMCNRARLAGGSCVIESEPGTGTTITSRVPCAGGPAEVP